MNTYKALVIGLGISGKSAVSFLESKGYQVVGFDDRIALVDIGEMRDFSLVILSPGIPQSHPLCQRATELGIPIKGEMQLALEHCKKRCIGITGSAGKTTTTLQIAHVLRSSGLDALAVGNVGLALTSAIDSADILIVELSSFQLETLSIPIFEMGLILNLFPNHLDRYQTMEEYGRAKARLENCLKEDAKLFVHPSMDSHFFKGPISQLEEGNATEVACAHFGLTKDQVTKGLQTFKKPAHRLEFVGEIEKVLYYNDSKATSIASVEYALDHLEQKPTILLMGGQDKGLDFAKLSSRSNQIKQVVAFGSAREKIANALQPILPVKKVETMDDAINFARQCAKPGDSILLSPGCSSYDAFRNFEERGEVFKHLVQGRKE